MEKFAGVGLANILIIWLICCMLTVITKTVVLKYDAIPDSVQAVVTSV